MADTAETDSLLGQDAFQTSESQRLFEAIDDLRRCGAKKEIDLPELVIIGDQSAGKSSLLQSLMDIPFPVAGRLCTRFPTRIISRRTADKTDVARVSIEPSFKNDFEPIESSKAFSTGQQGVTATAYNDFARQVPHLSTVEFGNIMSEASQAMGIGEDRNFSNDVLKIEISGPTRSHFSIVDVPGIFQSVTKDLTKEEMSGVRTMVESYIKPKQSVIICVANGTNDLVNQAVFDMARSIDPTGERSVGVITKCDVTQHPIELVRWAQNEDMYLAHGWFVVRNRTPKEAETGITSDDRLRKEKDFFEAEPWVDLPTSRRGTEALKRYLAQLLCNRIQDNFPAMLMTVRTRKAMVLDELNAMAGPRTTVEEKRTYLSEIAHDFYSQSSDALRGRYEALRSDDWKIRRLVRQLNEEFALRVIANGHYLPFAEVPQPKTYSNIPAQEHLAAVAGSSFPASSDAPSGFVFKDTSASAKPNEQEAAKSSTLFSSPASATQAANSSSLFSSSAPSGNPFAGSTSVGGDAPSGIFGGGTSSGSGAFSTGFGVFGNGVSLEGGPSTKGQDSPRAEDQKHPVDKKTAKKPLFDFSNNVSNSNNPKSALPPKPSSNRHSAQSKASDLIYGWIRQQVMSCRGTELQGTINPDILPILFREQSRNWGGIAKNHFTDLAVQVESICIRILEETCEEENVRRKIREKILAANRECMERGEASLARRITELQNRHLQTHNPDFERKVAEAKRLRFCTALERFRTSSALNTVFEKETRMRESLVVVDLSDTDSLFKELHMSNARNLENEIHDTLKAYYEIERANFIENVTQLIVETYLNDPEGPVLRFSPMYVSRLSDQEIQELAAEDEAIIQTRKEKEATLSRLKQAEAIAKKWA